MTATRWLRRFLPLLAASSCAGNQVPDPAVAGEQYSAAIKNGDPKALHALLDEESRRALGEERVAHLLAQGAPELRRRAEAFAGFDGEVRARAEVRFSDGEVVAVELEDGHFRVSSALAFPSGATTPVQALHELRAALSRRSYPALLQLLSSDTRRETEAQLSELTEALEQPETLDVVVDGDRATVTTSGGHRIELRNQGGVWKIRDFE